jgi:hypothetical protein
LDIIIDGFQSSNITKIVGSSFIVLIITVILYPNKKIYNQEVVLGRLLALNFLLAAIALREANANDRGAFGSHVLCIGGRISQMSIA